MKKLLVTLLYFSALLLISEKSFASSRSFTTSLTALTDAYADAEKIAEAHDVLKINRSWCTYFTNSDVGLGERIAVLSLILRNSDNSYYDSDNTDTYSNNEEQEYLGEDNYKIFNAFILAKYNLAKVDYTKMSVEDALVHILFNQGYYGSTSDILFVQKLQERNPESLAVATILVALVYYYKNNYSSEDAPDPNGIQNLNAAKKIAHNYATYNTDMRLAAAEGMLSEIIESSPCSNDVSMHIISLSCNCQFDQEGNERTWEEKIQCVETAINSEYSQNMVKWNDAISEFKSENKNETAQLLQELIVHTQSWIESENDLIASFTYETLEEQRIRQLLQKQLAIKHASVEYEIYQAYGIEAFTALINHFHPEVLKKQNDCDESFYEASQKKQTACMDFVQKEIDKILIETYNEMGGDNNSILKKSQNTWLLMRDGIEKISTNEDEKGEMQRFLLLMACDRIGLLKIYTTKDLSNESFWNYGAQLYEFLQNKHTHAAPR